MNNTFKPKKQERIINVSIFAKQRNKNPDWGGGITQAIIDRIEELERECESLKQSLKNKLDSDKVVNTSTITQPGFAADARQLNSSFDGSVAKIAASINGAYYVSKHLEQDFVCNEQKWTPIDPFSYVLPKRSIVIMSVDFSYTQNRDASLDMFIANSFYRSDHLNMRDTRVQECRAFIEGSGRRLDVAVGSTSDYITTIKGSADDRYSHVDYIVIPIG